jgi:hypothetical protein
MSQPKWKCVAQLGDASPVEYGGYWVFVDETGVYTPEAELWEPGPEEGDEGTVSRFSLEICTYVNGVLSDNKYHPNHPAWFAEDLTDVARCVGLAVSSLRKDLCSSSAATRAIAYRSIGEFHGFLNFDQYPLTVTEAEARRRYKAKKYKVI